MSNSGISMLSTSATRNKPLSRKSFMLALVAVIPAMMMVMIDSTAMNVAIPSLSSDLHVSFAILQWVITAYMLAMTITIPLAGWFSDKQGAAKALICAVLVFVIGSFLCAMAQNVEQLIVFRIVQGLGGGMIQPIGMAIVFRLAPVNKKGQVMGMLGIPMLLAPASGPVLSGWLLQIISWNWIFWINVPLGLVTIILIMCYLCPLKVLGSNELETRSLDLLGLFLAPTSFVLLVLSLNLNVNLWLILCLGIGGAILLVWFWFHELRHPHPLLELRAFRVVQFRRGMFISWIQYMALNGSIVFIPQFLQNVKQYTPLQAGLVMSTLAITSGLLMPIGGRWFDRFGIRPLAISGLGTVALSLFLLSEMAGYVSGIWIGVIVGCLGVGMGLCMMSLNTYILQASPAESVSRVTPLTSASANFIIPLSIAGLSQFLSMQLVLHRGEEMTVIETTAIAAYSDTFRLAAGIALIGALYSWWLKSDMKK